MVEGFLAVGAAAGGCAVAKSIDGASSGMDGVWLESLASWE